MTALAIAVVGSFLSVNQAFFALKLWVPISDLTRGLLSANLQAGLLLLAVVVFGVIILGGQYTPKQLGLDSKKLVTGIVLSVVVWFMVQLVATIVTLSYGDAFITRQAWLGEHVTWTIGELFGQLFGNALYEEILWRGFVLVQCLILFGRIRKSSSVSTVVLAVLLAALLFAVSHVPNRLMKGTYGGVGDVLNDQLRLVAYGCVFGWMYLRTKNLFFLVGVHAFVNRPTMLIDIPRGVIEPHMLVLFFGIVITVFWPWIVPHRLVTERMKAA
ncbi:CPBP family intramembrane metalloprotease [candidate division GN15 bacterium]|nr:CPBP family intramembrane metalloprotease [candidate division GN15 bacterium]